MCGIAGSVERGRDVDVTVLDAQLECLLHRGPDASAGFAEGAGGVGQTRLAVIDLDTGDPPIHNEDSSVGVALNGEIYNFGELRDELLERGHRLATRGDTEVIAHLAEELEPTALAAKLDGMFAFAVWDTRRERLILGRDRFGKKPLYYWEGDGRLVFASEIKALLAHPDVPRDLDPSAIPAYLTFGYVPTPRSFFRGVRSVPPGHVLVWEGGSARLDPFWSPPIAGLNGAAPVELSMDEAAGQVRSLLEGAVRRRLVADVPLGAFLSGGIDSSTVVGIMAQVMDRPVKTFTIGFEDDEGFDERPYAEVVANRFSTEHTEFVVKPDAVDLVERLVWHHDQPFGDSSAIPTFLLSELTRGHVTVALCGDGGDELFAGYERFGLALAASAYRRLPRPLRRLSGTALAALPARVARGRLGSAQRFAVRAEMGFPDGFRSWISVVQEPLLREMVDSDDDWAFRDYRHIWAESNGAELLDRLLVLNLRTYLLDDLLPKVDRMSMAHALEVRSPFLDRALAEFALRLPPWMKIRRIALKAVLKHAVRDLLPPEIVRREKRGFGVPLDRWFRTDLKSYVWSTLGAPTSRVREHLRSAPVERLLAEHDAGHRNHGHLLWSLLTLEIFLRNEGW